MESENIHYPSQVSFMMITDNLQLPIIVSQSFQGQRRKY